MSANLLKAKHYEPYFMAHLVKNVLAAPTEHPCELEEFFSVEYPTFLLAPFREFSIFENFISTVIHDAIYNEPYILKADARVEAAKKLAERMPSMGNDFMASPIVFPLNEALHCRGIRHRSFRDWLELQEESEDPEDNGTCALDYYEYLLDHLDESDSFIYKLTEKVWSLLSGDREVLTLFYNLIAKVIAGIKLEDLDAYDKQWLEKDGVLRKQPVPGWLKEVMFETGHPQCAKCHAHLPGALLLKGDEECFDYLVPLERGGVNDKTNLQFICARCRERKLRGPLIFGVRHPKVL